MFSCIKLSVYHIFILVYGYFPIIFTFMISSFRTVYNKFPHQFVIIVCSCHANKVSLGSLVVLGPVSTSQRLAWGMTRGVHGRVNSSFLNIKPNHLYKIFKSINQTKPIKLAFFNLAFFEFSNYLGFSGKVLIQPYNLLELQIFL